MIPLTHILILSALLFSIGVLGVMLRRNVIVIFMSIELMLNAVNLSFIGFARSLESMTGVVFIFFIIVVAAAEAVVGRSIILAIYRTRKSLNIDDFNLLKWLRNVTNLADSRISAVGLLAQWISWEIFWYPIC